MKYFVVSSDGQKYGPADVLLLNQWITEGRLLPTAMLQEENSQLQVQASTVPVLKFGVPGGGAPPIAPPSANPYDTPRPMSSYQPQPFQSSYPGSKVKNSTINSQIMVGWACTIGAPILIYFTYIGLILMLPGFRAAASLWSEDRKGHAIGMFIVNGLSACLWIYVRIAAANGQPLH